MKCPLCGFAESKVVDSRPSNSQIKRRRECLKCKQRFTTFEIIENNPIMIIKKDGNTQPFDKQKLLKGLVIACQKRPVTYTELENLVDEIEYKISNSFKKEINSKEIGEIVLERLKQIDLVAYIRFASVYREFSDIESFLYELKELDKK